MTRQHCPPTVPKGWKPAGHHAIGRKASANHAAFLRDPGCAIYFRRCVTAATPHRPVCRGEGAEEAVPAAPSTNNHDGRRDEGQSGSSVRRVRRSVSRCETAGCPLPFRTGFFCFCFCQCGLWARLAGKETMRCQRQPPPRSDPCHPCRRTAPPPSSFPTGPLSGAPGSLRPRWQQRLPTDRAARALAVWWPTPRPILSSGCSADHRGTSPSP